jgi:16S rRNA (cytosine967-C5)-methyltransferase
LKPHGRLIYSVCTLTRSETTAVADAFTAAHPEMEPFPLFHAHHTAHARSETTVNSPPPSDTQSAGQSQLLLWPHELNANGMFIAGWRRR